MITENFKPLTNDLCFKYVFSKKEILEDFLNSKDRFEFSNIILEKFIMPNNKEDSLYFGDIVANTIIDKSIISLEMYKDAFTKEDYNKSFAYMCRLYDKSIKNNNYEEAKKVYSINLMKGNFRKINSKLINIYKFKNEESKEIDNGNIEMYLIRFDNVKNIPYNILENRFIRWIRIINAKDYEELKKYSEGDEIMNEVNKFVSEWCKESNKNGFEKYVAEKAAKAETKGKKEGILETAKSMLIKGYDINDIVEITKLDIKEIQKLKVQIN